MLLFLALFYSLIDHDLYYSFYNFLSLQFAFGYGECVDVNNWNDYDRFKILFMNQLFTYFEFQIVLNIILSIPKQQRRGPIFTTETLLWILLTILIEKDLKFLATKIVSNIWHLNGTVFKISYLRRYELITNFSFQNEFAENREISTSMKKLFWEKYFSLGKLCFL